MAMSISSCWMDRRMLGREEMYAHNWAFLWGTVIFPTIKTSLCRESSSVRYSVGMCISSRMSREESYGVQMYRGIE